MRPYETNPSAIYAQSFATVQKEARLDRFPTSMHPLITRLIHACGMVEIADRLAFSPDVAFAGHHALQSGAPILCDCEMVGAGIIRRYLPSDNQVIVTLNDPRTPDHAKSMPSATHPPRCSTCSTSSIKASPNPPRSSASPWALSAPPNPKPNLPPIHAMSISSRCAVAKVAQPWPLLRSTHWPLACQRCQMLNTRGKISSNTQPISNPYPTHTSVFGGFPNG